MAKLSFLKRSNTLLALSVLEIGTPFVRMMMLSRLLEIGELGFAAAITSVYGMFEQVTDIAIFRFVISTERKDYQEALASAHALSILRGLSVGLLAMLVSPLVAALFSLQADWLTFAVLGFAIFVRSFEHLEPRVAERDYNFDQQFKTSVVSSGLCILALAGALATFHDHRALIVSLFAQNIALVVASHSFSASAYRVDFKSPYLLKAFRFGYPLMFNGLGLAVSSQGDRFLVGAMLGLPALGVYSVILLAVVVPMTLFIRMMGSISGAALYNARDSIQSMTERVKLTVRLSPIVAATYAIGVLFFANIVVPLVFGPKFMMSTLGLSVIALGAYFRLARVEPFNSLLILSQRTKRLALSNLSVSFALLFAFGLLYFLHSVESALLGRMLGELLSLGVTLYLTRNLLHGRAPEYVASFLLGLICVGSAIAVIHLSPVGSQWPASLAALFVYAIVLLGWAALSGGKLVRKGAFGPLAAAEMPDSVKTSAAIDTLAAIEAEDPLH